jgi:hypothetical protein
MRRVTKILKAQAQRSAIERASDRYQTFNKVPVSPTFLPPLRNLGGWRRPVILGRQMIDGHHDVPDQRLVPTNSSKLKYKNTTPGGAFVRSIKKDADKNMAGAPSRCRAITSMEVQNQES